MIVKAALNSGGLEQVLLAFGDVASARRAARTVAEAYAHPFIPGHLNLEAVPAALALMNVAFSAWDDIKRSIQRRRGMGVLELEAIGDGQRGKQKKTTTKGQA